MIIIDKVQTCGWEPALRGMRNLRNSWNRADSIYNHDKAPDLGYNDLALSTTLAKGGPVHAKYRRMITIYCDITAPLYWWKEFDTYKVGTVANSCSTMHKLHEKPLTLDNFAYDYLSECQRNLLQFTIDSINECRRNFLDAPDADTAKQFWNQMIQLLPSSYLQKRTVMFNYEVASNIYHSPRWNHKLSEWRIFCEWLQTLPYAKYLIVDPYQFDNDLEKKVKDEYDGNHT